MKNIVFIPNIKVGDGARSISYQYSINSWKHFCDKHNCELLVWEDLLFPIEDMKITWQRYYLFDILEGNNIDYDQILMVDGEVDSLFKILVPKLNMTMLVERTFCLQP